MRSGMIEPRAPDTGSDLAFAALVVGTDLFRQESARWLGDAGANPVMEASTIRQARAWPQVSGIRSVVCLIQLRLPDGSGADLARSLPLGWNVVLAAPATPIGPTTVQLALSAQARACTLTHRQPPNRTPPRRRRSKNALGLSAREIEVITHVAEGRTNAEIASHMGLSNLTIKSHLGRIGRQLGSGDRAHIVAVAMRGGALS